jgi:hypothetical protein
MDSGLTFALGVVLAALSRLQARSSLKSHTFSDGPARPTLRPNAVRIHRCRDLVVTKFVAAQQTEVAAAE